MWFLIAMKIQVSSVFGDASSALFKAISSQPGTGPFHHPAPRQQWKPLGMDEGSWSAGHQVTGGVAAPP